MNKIISVIAILLTSLFVEGQPDTSVFNSQYYSLQKALAKYEYIETNGGWDSIPDKSKFLKQGDVISFNALLRKRLEIEGYWLPPNEPENDSLKKDLTEAIKTFQENNGLAPTGELNRATLEMLNIPVQGRIRQIKSNMERWKMLPADLGDHYLFVNVADFLLSVIENNGVFMQMKIIVGRTYRRTPVFSSRLTQIIFNPSWHIPPSILKNDVLPQIKKDKKYLQEKHIRVFKTDKNQKLIEVLPDSIDWKNISANNFPYKLIQDPGEENALGMIKFLFPNDYNVYMHDTPSKELFEKPELTFSSGCIRLSHALDLAMYLLKGEEKWTPEKIIQTIGNGRTITVPLPKPVNVYIQYFTAWVNEQGMTVFRKDIYKRD